MYFYITKSVFVVIIHKEKVVLVLESFYKCLVSVLYFEMCRHCYIG